MPQDNFDRQVELRVPARDTGGGHAVDSDASLGDLIKQLTSDTGELVRQELSLAKAEMRETGATLAREGMKIGVALGLALAGLLALTAFLVVALGDWFDNYWLGALVLGVLFLAIGGIMAKNAVNDIKEHGVKPDETMRTLREDAAWAKREAREVKRELTR